MAKSKLIEEQESKKIAAAVAKKDVHAVPSAEDAHLYKPSFENKKEEVSTPGHTRRDFRN